MYVWPQSQGTESGASYFTRTKRYSWPLVSRTGARKQLRVPPNGRQMRRKKHEQILNLSDCLFEDVALPSPSFEEVHHVNKCIDSDALGTMN